MILTRISESDDHLSYAEKTAKYKAEAEKYRNKAAELRANTHAMSGYATRLMNQGVKDRVNKFKRDRGAK